MTKKSERLRQRLADLQTELKETEKDEKRREREHAQRVLVHTARRAGLLTALAQSEGEQATLLEREFMRIAGRIDDRDSSADTASAGDCRAAHLASESGTTDRDRSQTE